MEPNLRQKLSQNLMGADPNAFSATVLYIVYKTVVNNDSIILGRLKRLLQSHLFLSEQSVDGALAGLVHEYGAIKRFLPKNKPHEFVQLHVAKKPSDEFNAWLAKTEESYPELKRFEAPLYQMRNKAEAA